MTKVWVVFSDVDYEGQWIHGIYATEDRAREHFATMKLVAYDRLYLACVPLGHVDDLAKFEVEIRKVADLS